MASDKEIIMAMRENQERGFRLLMASYKEPVYWHIRRLVVSHDDAQDAAQESFVRIFRNFGQYSEENSFKAWIFRIATNEALRLLGRQKNATMLSLDDVTADMLSTKTDEYFDNSDTIAARLQQAILHLPKGDANDFDSVQLAYNNLTAEDQEFLTEIYEDDEFMNILTNTDEYEENF
jgi:RNA polymerase sigma-70 factor (ECF subfamily)